MGNILHSQAASAVDRPDVLGHFAGNVRRLRLDQGLSQQALAERSGLSRRMINAIEGDKANVSLSTVDKLAAALGVTFTRLVRAPDAGDSARIETIGWRGRDPRSSGVLLGAAPSSKEAELWVWTLAPKERYRSEDDSQNWHEMLLVIDGVLTIESAAGERALRKGEFTIFSSAEPYWFVNRGPAVCRYVRNVVL